ncbi:PAAR domain-containing protein [Cupriavidus consociatus]|uniref:PAAR domain-containing protein n=1 Tax=Cupriavidus consociatus TaxID=2821357 RepID=UPI001AEB2A7C|nr:MULTISPECIES: PAAR domain-containing protein [unclassified Cupriavidus]MBP0622003.1 PAAR domain-containing protein [Cupriavidus sp. LEh25]MDK2658679.1 PAAR domain-containing protein [Cupriavidus sp. LEh21]
MMRRIAVIGDALLNGGRLLPYGGSPCTFGDSGHQVVLIGGQAYCEACKSTGTIAKAGGPRRMRFMGEVALDGDVVMCKCPSPPRIVATLSGNAWYEDMGTGDGVTRPLDPGLAESVARGLSTSTTFDELVIAVGPHGPLADYPYFVETSDGRRLFGHTDEQGHLPRVATIEAGTLTVYWGDEALAKHLGDGNA